MNPYHCIFVSGKIFHPESQYFTNLIQTLPTPPSRLHPLPDSTPSRFHPLQHTDLSRGVHGSVPRVVSEGSTEGLIPAQRRGHVDVKHQRHLEGVRRVQRVRLARGVLQLHPRLTYSPLVLAGGQNLFKIKGTGRCG